ncbi:MAG: flagellar transcriptional regulator FlhD [Limnobacter sp.]|nr:flagellar transcriptional regulator FlhD [Limnobacter sp.]
MKSERLLDEIRETNLSYLLLAQQLIREDKKEAAFRLGISEEVAALIAQLTTSQALRIASGSMLMCRFRFDDEVVWNLLTSHSKDRSASGIHASILMASKALEVTSDDLTESKAV